MEQTPKLEADSRLAGQEIPHLLWKLHNPDPLECRRHTRPVSVIFTLLLYSHLRRSLLRFLFPSGFRTEISYAFFNLLMEWYISCPSHSSRVGFSGVIW